jgi:nucleoside 2-deoxyribosyltransferase
MLKIYLSAPVFSQLERRWNRELAARLTRAIKDAEVVLPQDFKIAGRYNDRRHFPAIFRKCLASIDACDMVVAVLDGADVDSGVAFEVGYASARGKPVVGVRTDFRQNQERGLNIMLSRACTRLLLEMSFGEDNEQLVRDLVGKIVATIRELREA